MVVIYVDDDPTICWLTVREWKHAFPDDPSHTAHTPAEALAAIEGIGQALGAALVDWRLADITAEKLVQELRARFPRLCIIATSAVTDPKQLVAARQAGADRFLEKELSVQIFVRQLATEIAKVVKEREGTTPA